MMKAGWSGTIEEYIDEDSKAILESLNSFIVDVGESQIRAWRDSIPKLRNVLKEYIHLVPKSKCSVILEYELPMEGGRRPDVLVLIDGTVAVLELKGYGLEKQEDVDQVSAYARDLRNYHSMCRGYNVIPILVPLQMRGPWEDNGEVKICGPDKLPKLLQENTLSSKLGTLNSEDFLQGDYEPMPTLVEAARRMFEDNELPNIRRARAATDPALKTCIEIIHEAARTQSRHLILLSGVPGSGKTLVGIRLSYDRSTTPLAIPREIKRPRGIIELKQPEMTSVFLSGNGPLVEVLQDALGKNSKNFIQPVRSYVKYHFGGGKNSNQSRIPWHHVLIFDEAQRAWDRDKVERGHRGELQGSEPELFVNIANRAPKWSVIVGLIGTGQEIHDGEEAGVTQWLEAISEVNNSENWIIHAPPQIAEKLNGSDVEIRSKHFLSLNVTLRSHFAEYLHEWVEGAIGELEYNPEDLDRMATALKEEGFRMYITDNLLKAKMYAINRYENAENKRYGLLASSRDKSLSPTIPNDYMATRNVRKGAWFNESYTHPRSCCQLNTCLTEFGVQGLELDFCIIGWGTDFILNNGVWTNHFMKKHARNVPVQDPLALRRNAYRVLLTRARDGFIIYIPPDNGIDSKYQGALDETRKWFQECGVEIMK